ncbi:hypothetical protein V493_05377 [Pseudogymnoascus sp. VKM F-4281 (FW-2241)]|nr:hypothetical protein V493_05377 [Pseudogymnoascus sp. VKM F-4281 (FW-2241)]
MESTFPKRRRKAGKPKDALFPGEASTSFRRWDKGISKTNTSNLRKCSGPFLGALMRRMDMNLISMFSTMQVDSIISGKMNMDRRLYASFESIWKETERLKTDPELFPSEGHKKYFWHIMDTLTRKLEDIRNMYESWSDDNEALFEFQPINLDFFDASLVKNCEACDRICLIELHDAPLPLETVKQRGLSLLNGPDPGMGYIYIDFDWFNKYTREDMTFPGQDNDVYRIPRANEVPSQTLHDTRVCRWRLRSKCWQCGETWVEHTLNEDHPLEQNGPSTKKTWRKWLRNLNQPFRTPRKDIQSNNFTIRQRIPLAAGMLLRRARFMYSSITRRYETSAFQLAQATGENYLLLKQKENHIGRIRFPFPDQRTAGILGDAESIEGLSLIIRSFQGRLHSGLGLPLVMEITRQNRPRMT